ncbi:MAG: hypothetical protein M3405_01420 [Acidobacteriota bacterium]|jgi:protein required for attachment to host cells|nr:hypothetical protein [Acidobacteriota bacterium]
MKQKEEKEFAREIHEKIRNKVLKSKLKFVIFGLPRSKLTGHSPEN